eukprot:GHVH01008834.1.p1 GENE.GHVH01008834.1~~GHVH01008834.1.p1  ORF type:complete len:332 (+),score=57.18 GHVH01008834.1:210-1205(+)
MEYNQSHEEHFWTAEDVSLEQVVLELSSLPNNLKNAFLELLSQDSTTAFGSDDHENSPNGIPPFQLDKCAATSALTNDLQIPEARAFYGFQSSYENIVLELQCSALLHACNESHEEMNRLILDASISPIGVQRALLWQRHVWDESEVPFDEPPPSLQERVLSDGLLKEIQVSGHRILRSILRDHYPKLDQSCLAKVLDHTIELSVRHTAFSAMIHKTFTQPILKDVATTLLNDFLSIELEFLSTRVFPEGFEGMLNDDLKSGITKSLLGAFGIVEESTTAASVLNSTGGFQVTVPHELYKIEGDELVETQDINTENKNDPRDFDVEGDCDF